ncbi:MAG: hypothetical protein M1832_002545 [Thelocarpon impressellum]|nr:MAG: hypothetical protein M1832_002545 [Thelocarpon impressellum]
MKGRVMAKGTPRQSRSARDRPGLSVAPVPDRPESEPLRARPPQQLGLEHFKVNPEYNQGVDYAFVETVRKKDVKRCLPGCSRVDCCGGRFRKVVELGGVPAPQKSKLRWNSSQDDEDQQLLEEYLGNDYGRVRRMNEVERQEALVQARTKQFADKHGRHRHAYDRRTTPPGFWRTEMPTTQEQKDDQEEARMTERRKVDERYREAMRGGSKWVFRDE